LLASVVLSSSALARIESSPLSLHDALPISPKPLPRRGKKSRGHESRNGPAMAATTARSLFGVRCVVARPGSLRGHMASGRWRVADRKSTRLNSSHVKISYAVFCLKKKNGLNQEIAPSRDVLTPIDPLRPPPPPYRRGGPRQPGRV